MSDTARQRTAALVARALDTAHEANGFTLGYVERAEHRRMGEAVSFALLMKPALVYDLYAEGLALAEGVTS